MSACPDDEKLARVVTDLASVEPVLAAAIADSTHRADDAGEEPWQSDDAAELGDVDDLPDDDLPVDDDPDDDDPEERAEDGDLLWWPWYALPYATALRDTVRAHHAWAEQEFGLDPDVVLVTSPGIRTALRLRVAKWLAGMKLGRTPKLARFSHLPGHRTIDALLSAQLSVAGQAWPCSPRPDALELLDGFLAAQGDPDARRKADARPPRMDLRNYHVLGACVCWFLIDRYAEAWNRSWHLGRFELG